MDNNSSSVALSCDTLGTLVVNAGANHIYYGISIFSIFWAILDIFINGAVIIALVSIKRYSSPSDILLIMLSVTDLLTGILVLPSYCIYMMQLSRGQTVCIFSNVTVSLTYCLVLMSVITIGFITIELYLAIVRPFIYLHRINKVLVIPLLLSSWTVLILTIAIMQYMFPNNWPSFSAVFGGFFMLVYIGLCIVYKMVYNEAMKIKKTSCSKLKSNKKIVKMTFFVLAGFGLCGFPHVLMNISMFIWSSSMTWIEIYISPWCELIAMSNALLDPIIYCFRIKLIRRAIVPKFFWKSKRIGCFLQGSQRDLQIYRFSNQLSSSHAGISILPFTYISILTSQSINKKTNSNSNSV